MAGVQAGPARAREGVVLNSGPRKGDAVPEARAGGIAGASGGPREAALEGGSTEEGEEEQAGGLDLIVDTYHFPIVGFHLTFLLNLVRSVLNRIYYNNHILVRPHDGHVSVQHQARQHLSDQDSAVVGEFSELHMSWDGPRERPAGKAPAQEVEEAEERSLRKTAAKESEESSLWEMAQEPAAPEEITKYQDENSKKEIQDTESEWKEEKYNKKEEPERNLDPAKDRPKKSRYLLLLGALEGNLMDGPASLEAK
ncbi:cancer/testis antigen family 47 member C1 [Moschus berezovskii]|uniref:cancer/testis antigen family 47 member C1 n=1 Tax=Moschus berezovskii TaxID=68408 RepID=UPI002445270F|nr:cancer/testis antigen family 47 member C1 [Moschus berezovskii]